MKYRSRTSIAVLGLFLLLAASRIATANVAPKWSDEQLAGFSAAIFTGRVTHIASGVDTSVDSIYTYVTIEVAGVLKGNISTSHVVLKQLGGLVDGTAQRVIGQARFAVGEEVLIFAEVRPRDGTLYTTALWQGKWTAGPSAAGARELSRSDPDTPDGAVDRRDASAMMAAMALRASQDPRSESFVVAPPEAPVAGGVDPYQLFDNPARWTTQPVEVDVRTGGQPGLTNGGVPLLQAQHIAWSTAGAAFTYQTRSLLAASRCGLAFPTNGVVTHNFNDPCGEISNSGGILALTFYTASAFVQSTVNGVGFRRILQAIVITNDGTTAQQFVRNENCFQQVMLHELGHALGLAHSDDSSAIMFATIEFAQCSVAAQPLQGDDVAGVIFIYPGAGPPSPPLPPQPPPQPPPPPPPPPPVSISAITGKMLPVNGAVTVPFTVSSGTVPPSAITVSVTTSNPILLPAATGLTLVNLGNGQWQLIVRPAAEQRGVAFVAVTATDGGTTASVGFYVTVGPPNAPQMLSTTLSGSGVQLLWAPPAAGQAGAWAIERYAIAGGLSFNGSELPVVVTPNATTSYVFPALPNGQYYFRVYAIGPTGLSDPVVGGAAIAHGAFVPGPVTGLEAALIGGTNVSLDWLPGAGGSSLTQLEVGSVPGAANLGILTTTALPFSANVAPLGAGTFWVRARSVAGGVTGGASNDVALTVPSGACTAAPGTPIMLPVTVRAQETTVSWLPITGQAAAQYRIEVMPGLGTPPMASLTTAGAVSSFVLPALPGGFAVHVFAENACGSSGHSNVVIVP